MSSNPGWTGLSEEEARSRWARFGPNRLPDPQAQTWLQTVLEVVREPMFVLLLVGAGLYLLVGEPSEGLLLGGFAMLTVGLVVLQSRRRERALQALRQLSTPQAQVCRDGIWVVVDAARVVPGDCLLLEEGQRVAADAVLRRSTGLTVDESLLTGESWPVGKAVGVEGPVPITTAREGDGGRTDDRVWAGTLVVAGQAVAGVVATGVHTRMGAIGVALSAIEVTATPAQLRIRRPVQTYGPVALCVSLAVMPINGLWRGDWLNVALTELAWGTGSVSGGLPEVMVSVMDLVGWG